MEIIVRRQFAASPDRVWSFVGDFAGCARWCLVGSCTVSGEGIGAVRTVTGAGGGIADELRLYQELTELDPVAKAIAYTMTDSERLPWRNYRARIVVAPTPTGSEVSWTCNIDPLIPKATAAQSVTQTYDLALSNLARLLEG